MTPSLLFALAVLLANPGGAALTVRGVVLDADRAPVEGAHLTLVPLSGWEHGAPVTASSDAHGAFEIAGTGGSPRYRLAAEGPDGAVAFVEDIEPGCSDVALGTILLLPPATLRGRVLDAKGQPIAGAEVHALHRDQVLATAASAKDGGFEIAALPPMQIALEVRAPGRADTVFRLDLADDAARGGDFTLADAAPLAGRCVDAAGKPAAGARVEVRRPAGEPGLPLAATCDAEGRFTIDSLGDRAGLVLSIRASGAPLAEFSPATPPADGIYRLAPGQRITVDAAEADGSPVAIALVRADVFTRSGDGWKRVEGEFDRTSATVLSDSRFEIAVPPGDSLRIQVRAADGRERLLKDMQPGPEMKVEARFAKRQAISGRVLGLAGKPVAGMRVDLGRTPEGAVRLVAMASTVSDDEGRFRFDGLNPETWWIQAWSDAALSEAKSVPLPEGGDTENVELTIGPAPSLQGRVTIDGKAPGMPLVVHAVRYQRQGPSGNFKVVATSMTDADGTYRLAPLPLGRITLVPLPPPRPESGALAIARLEHPADNYKTWPYFKLLRDATRETLDADLKVQPAAVVHGVARVNGKPRAGARVGLDRGTGDPSWISADDQGRYRLVVVGSGPGDLRLESGGVSARKTVEWDVGGDVAIDLDASVGAVSGKIAAAQPSAGPLRVSLERPATDAELKERLRNPTQLDDTPWVGVAEAQLAPDGAYRFDEVECGRYRIALEDLSNALARVATAPFDVAPAATAEVPSLPAPTAGRLHVVVALEEGAKAPFASLKITAPDGAAPLPRTYVGWFVDGKCEVAGLPPGRVRVQVVPYGKFKAEGPLEVDVASGATAELSVPVHSG